MPKFGDYISNPKSDLFTGFCIFILNKLNQNKTTFASTIKIKEDLETLMYPCVLYIGAADY